MRRFQVRICHSFRYTRPANEKRIPVNNGLERAYRFGGEGGIRTLGAGFPAQLLSRQPCSTTPAPLRTRAVFPLNIGKSVPRCKRGCRGPLHCISTSSSSSSRKLKSLSEGIFIYGIGLGNVDKSALSRLSRATGGYLETTTNPATLSDLYRRVLQSYYRTFGDKLTKTGTYAIRSLPQGREVNRRCLGGGLAQESSIASPCRGFSPIVQPARGRSGSNAGVLRTTGEGLPRLGAPGEWTPPHRTRRCLGAMLE